MIYKFIMPKLGWTMEQGKIIKWYKKEGENVSKGEQVLEIETDKVSIKVEAPETGVLAKILYNENEVCPVDQVIALISDDFEKDKEEAINKVLKEINLQTKSTPRSTPETSGDSGAKTPLNKIYHEKLLATPKARRIAREKGIDLSKIKIATRDGIIRAQDVEKYALDSASTSRVKRFTIDPRLSILDSEDISGIRKVIAERMYSSLQNSAQLTISAEIIVDNLVKFRNKLNKERRYSNLPKISFTDLIVFVISDLLESYPKLNASFDGKSLHFISNINLGVASATDRGLMVPVVWDANKLTLDDISTEIKSLSRACRDGTVNLDRLSGSTFTVTNLGMFGIEVFTPIVNPPENAILGVGTIKIKPVYKNNGIEPASVMTLSLSFDHQIIDGHEAAIFLGELKKYLQDPEMLEELYFKRNKMLKKHSELIGDKDIEYDHDIVIIGGGPAANDAAIEAKKMGLDVLIIEKDLMGGTCLNRGCVPLKNIFNNVGLIKRLKSKMEYASGIRVENVSIQFNEIKSFKDKVCEQMRDGMKKSLEMSGIKIYYGTGSFKNENTVQVTNSDGAIKEFTFKKAIIATGAKFPPINDSEGVKLINGSEVFDIEHLPSSMVFYGKNKLVLELASNFMELGVEDITVLVDGKLNLPFIDEDILNAMMDIIELNDIDIQENAKIKSIKKLSKGYKLHYINENGNDVEKETDLFVNCSSRSSNIETLELDNAGVKVDENNLIIVDDLYKTSNKNIYAIGDVINEDVDRLTYLASLQGRKVINAIIGLKENQDPIEFFVPRNLFMHPPFASVGHNEKSCKDHNLSYSVKNYPYSMNVEAHLEHSINGLIKFIFEKKTLRLLGVQVFGEGAHEIISIATVLIYKKGKIKDLLNTLFLHPTFSEIFKDITFSIDF
ncbi:MAG: 2-oxo acid dehydrogenase subunit E2 [Promethearchaeota archaeon]